MFATPQSPEPSAAESAGTTAFRAARDHLLHAAQDPAGAREAFVWPDVGADFNWAHDWFDVLARGNQSIALRIIETDGAEAAYSFDRLRRRSDQVANWLLALGVERGDVLMLMLGNRVELWEIMLAAFKIGAIVLPTSVVLATAELADRVDRAHVRFVMAAPEDAAKFSEVPGDYRGIAACAAGMAPEGWACFADSETALEAPVEKTTLTDDAALIYFTSGTTSLPKIVVHTHASYPVGHLSTMSWIGVRPGDLHLVISAPGWGKHAWSSFYGPWNAGATICVVNAARFDPAELVAQLDRAGVSTFCAPPTVWRMLIQSEQHRRPRALREVVSAGEPLNPEVIARIKEWWGLEIRDGYGQTETTALIGTMPGDPVVPGAMGRPLPGNRVVLLDPLSGAERDEGEICLPLADRPLNLMAGYFENQVATERACAGGYFHTGDVATRAADGTLTFVGRTDDIFKSSDFKVSPFEVESALIEHPAVAEAAVVGAPDDTRLNITKAYVALAAGWAPDAETARAVLAHARVALPPYMRVRRIEFAELPKTTSGKIRRVELRRREVDAHAANLRLEAEWREDDFPNLKGPTS
ncbi:MULTISPECIES: AMP-binding protein [unclassified Leucobacter]|uniref:AMP-binding protein n=1 Tax=unclassified Leucobacter TaxID=2621730 RepID=UPI00165D6FF8|nr:MULTISPECIES: AMP-binding protein [unclassified Leucobacter]MBC9936089.1 AMP-binding protein [Leucobacter sp. cx-87]